jgi:hypothetical protein
MTDSNEPSTEKREMRMMWIMTAVVVLAILGLMGGYVLTHPDWRHPAWAAPSNE